MQSCGRQDMNCKKNGIKGSETRFFTVGKRKRSAFASKSTSFKLFNTVEKTVCSTILGHLLWRNDGSSNTFVGRGGALFYKLRSVWNGWNVSTQRNQTVWWFVFSLPGKVIYKNAMGFVGLGRSSEFLWTSRTRHSSRSNVSFTNSTFTNDTQHDDVVDYFARILASKWVFFGHLSIDRICFLHANQWTIKKFLFFLVSRNWSAPRLDNPIIISVRYSILYNMASNDSTPTQTSTVWPVSCPTVPWSFAWVGCVDLHVWIVTGRASIHPISNHAKF